PRSTPRRPRAAIESLDPEVAARDEAGLPQGEETAASASEAAESAVWGTPADSAASSASSAAVPDWEMPSAPPSNGSPTQGRGEFNFGDLDPVLPPATESHPFSKGTAPEPPNEPSPFQEASPFQEPAREEEPAPPPAPEQVPEQPEPGVTMRDFSMPGAESDDPDEPHWRETYDRFVELK